MSEDSWSRTLFFRCLAVVARGLSLGSRLSGNGDGDGVGMGDWALVNMSQLLVLSLQETLKIMIFHSRRFGLAVRVCFRAEFWHGENVCYILSNLRLQAFQAKLRASRDSLEA